MKIQTQTLTMTESVRKTILIMMIRLYRCIRL